MRRVEFPCFEDGAADEAPPDPKAASNGEGTEEGVVAGEGGGGVGAQVC